MTIRTDTITAQRAYGAYGERSGTPGRSRSAFSGEVLEAGTGCYLLGARLYSPLLRRFLGPDALSPFDDGSFNRYAYCGGDPVNRVDPSGNAWAAWIGAALGMPKVALPTAGDNGASALGGSVGSNVLAMTSPAVSASVSSAIMDVTSPLTTLASVATATQGADKSGGLFGWMSVASGAASGALAPLAKATSGMEDAKRSRGVQTKYKVGYTKTSYTSSDGALQVDHYDGMDAVAKKAPERLRGGFRPEWKGIPNDNGGTNYVADGPITSADIRTLMKSIKKSRSTRPITLLSGVHGNRIGHNWKSGQRRGAEPRFYAKDRSNEREFASLAGRRGHTIGVVDLATLSDAGFVHITNSNSLIVHAYCYGLADLRFMRRYNIRRVTTYRV
jgi:RHS repeat-associated protein